MKNLKFFKGCKVAIIPARAGSQRIKNKNLRTVNKIPLINRTLNSCISSKIFDKIIVSTNSPEIENAVSEYSVCLHRRSFYNSRNISSTEDVIKEIFDFYESSIKSDSLIYLIQCTSPFLKSQDLIESYHNFKDSNSKSSVFSGYRFNKFIWESSRNHKEVTPINYIPTQRPRSQDTKPYVIENGAFYIFGKYNFDITQCRLHGNVDFYLMDELRSIDIDEEEDINFANYISNICD